MKEGVETGGKGEGNWEKGKGRHGGKKRDWGKLERRMGIG